MGVSSDMRSSRVRRQAAKKPNKERTVQVRFSDEELAALDAICSEKKMTRSAFLRSCVEKVQGGDVEPTYVVTRNADAERMASEAKSIGVNVNQIARVLNAESKSHPGSLSPGVLGECKAGLAEVRGELSKLTDEVSGVCQSETSGTLECSEQKRIREQRQAAPFLKFPLAGYKETFRRAVDGRTRTGRKNRVFVVRSFMGRIRKTRGTDGAK